jgi:hypothetical protein
LNDNGKKAALISTLVCASNFLRYFYEKATFSAFFYAVMMYAQSRFDETWKMKMDTLQFSCPPEDYLFAGVNVPQDTPRRSATLD